MDTRAEKLSSEDIPSGRLVLFHPHRNGRVSLVFNNGSALQMTQVQSDDIPSSWPVSCPVCGHTTFYSSRPEEEIPNSTNRSRSTSFSHPSQFRDETGSMNVHTFAHQASDYFFQLERNLDRAHAEGPRLLPSEHHVINSALNTGYYEKFFREIRILGQGSFGIVYLVEHILPAFHNQSLGTYALKKTCCGERIPWIVRELRQATMLQQLRHPNVLQYKHCWLERGKFGRFCEEETLLFMLSEYADCGSLTSELESTVRLSDKEVWAYLTDCINGLAHLHSLNIVHCDVKLDNFFLKRVFDTLNQMYVKRVLIGDFGQARFSDYEERTNQTGTLRYRPPEGVEPVFSLDMWGLGCCLYALLLGDLPFTSEECMDEGTLKSALDDLDWDMVDRHPIFAIILQRLLCCVDERISSDDLLRLMNRSGLTVANFPDRHMTECLLLPDARNIEVDSVSDISELDLTHNITPNRQSNRSILTLSDPSPVIHSLIEEESIESMDLDMLNEEPEKHKLIVQPETVTEDEGEFLRVYDSQSIIQQTRDITIAQSYMMWVELFLLIFLVDTSFVSLFFALFYLTVSLIDTIDFNNQRLLVPLAHIILLVGRLLSFEEIKPIRYIVFTTLLLYNLLIPVIHWQSLTFKLDDGTYEIH
ncbi:hypothetical protein PCE1_003078 [Barthelona sp. PCE]